MQLNESEWIRASLLGGERVYVDVVVFARAAGGIVNENVGEIFSHLHALSLRLEPDCQ